MRKKKGKLRGYQDGGYVMPGKQGTTDMLGWLPAAQQQIRQSLRGIVPGIPAPAPVPQLSPINSALTPGAQTQPRRLRGAYGLMPNGIIGVRG